MTNRRVLYGIVYEMLAMSHEAYTDKRVKRDKRGLAVVCPGIPLWVYLPEDMSDDDIRSFFITCMKKIKTPFSSLVADANAARICAELLAAARGGVITERAIAAYYLPGEINAKAIQPANGYLREAKPEDKLLINEWLNAFYIETFETELPEPLPQINESPPLSENNGRLYIWQDAHPSAMAMLCSANKGIARINLVYTPPELRRNGYGTAIVVALSQAAQKNGGIPMLYTDAGNATANALYQSLGFANAGRLVKVTVSPQLKQRIELG
jgi:predicted GNAT family acetyltransferase